MASAEGLARRVGTVGKDNVFQTTENQAYWADYGLDMEELLGMARVRLTRGWRPEECLKYLRTETCPVLP